jgi:hypothetical protein
MQFARPGLIGFRAGFRHTHVHGVRGEVPGGIAYCRGDHDRQPLTGRV